MMPLYCPLHTVYLNNLHFKEIFELSAYHVSCCAYCNTYFFILQIKNGIVTPLELCLFSINRPELVTLVEPAYLGLFLLETPTTGFPDIIFCFL